MTPIHRRWGSFGTQLVAVCSMGLVGVQLWDAFGFSVCIVILVFQRDPGDGIFHFLDPHTDGCRFSIPRWGGYQYEKISVLNSSYNCLRTFLLGTKTCRNIGNLTLVANTGSGIRMSPEMYHANLKVEPSLCKFGRDDGRSCIPYNWNPCFLPALSGRQTCARIF